MDLLPKKLNVIWHTWQEFSKKCPREMNIKWGFVDLYLLISKMDESYVIGGREEDFADFYVAFEKERREFMPDHSDLLSSGRNSWDRDLYDYIEAFIRNGRRETES